MIPFGKADRPDTRAAIVLGVNEFVVGCAGKPGGGRSILPRLVGATSGDIFIPVTVTVVVVAVEVGSAVDGDSGIDGIIESVLGRILTDLFVLVTCANRVVDIVPCSSLSDELSLSGSSV